MAKFYGVIGYGSDVETAPGVVRKVVHEKTYFGDLKQDILRTVEGENLNDDLRLNNTVSIVMDKYLPNHIHEILYVKWQGTAWRANTIEIKPPRLEIRLGGVYHGEQAGTTENP